MSDIFKIELTNEKKIKTGKNKESKLRTFTINRKNNKQMNMANFKDVYNVFKKKYGVEKIVVRAMNDTMFFTFKGFTDTELNIGDFEEYYMNKVDITKKFNMFNQVQISVLN